MRNFLRLLLLGLLMFDVPAYAEWIDLSATLGETDIRSVAADPNDAKVLYAASERRLYKSADEGRQWKQVLGLRGSENQIHSIFVDPKDSKRVYVASDKGIQRTLDRGKTWDYFYRGLGDHAKTVYCLALAREGSKVLWAGTMNGLVQISEDTREAQSVTGGLPQVRVHSITTDGKTPGREWVSTDNGIYVSHDDGAHWQHVHAEIKNPGATAEETAADQFQSEETAVIPGASRLIYFPQSDKLYAAFTRGVWQGQKGGEAWSKLDNADLPSKKVNDLARSSQTFYAATDQGVFEWDEKNGMKDISDGLPSKEVRMLAYSPASDDLFAATKKGVFRFPKPDFKFQESSATVPASTIVPLPDANAVLKYFENEPAIRQIQDAAIQYAEVHPDKIKEWREAAKRKAWLPKVSLNSGISDNHNVDIDRGGTNDPDRFIIGPDEKSFDWSVGASWDLAEMVWNNDQTSIDTRSRLMVELRDDVINEVTHLYYERRRLQVEMFLVPAKELPRQIERQLKLDELTANIDGLTGGYLSKALVQQESSFSSFKRLVK